MQSCTQGKENIIDKLIPVIHVVINEDLQLQFERLIQLLIQPIGLRMISTGYFVLKASELLEKINELVTDLVGNDFFRTSIIL